MPKGGHTLPQASQNTNEPEQETWENTIYGMGRVVTLFCASGFLIYTPVHIVAVRQMSLPLLSSPAAIVSAGQALLPATISGIRQVFLEPVGYHLRVGSVFLGSALIGGLLTGIFSAVIDAYVLPSPSEAKPLTDRQKYWREKFSNICAAALAGLVSYPFFVVASTLIAQDNKGERWYGWGEFFARMISGRAGFYSALPTSLLRFITFLLPGICTECIDELIGKPFKKPETTEKEGQEEDEDEEDEDEEEERERNKPWIKRENVVARQVYWRTLSLAVTLAWSTVLTPLDVISVRLLNEEGKWSIAQTVKTILAREGWRGLYRGWIASIIQDSDAFFFF